jgi:hypothetical protein
MSNIIIFDIKIKYLKFKIINLNYKFYNQKLSNFSFVVIYKKINLNDYFSYFPLSTS